MEQALDLLLRARALRGRRRADAVRRVQHRRGACSAGSTSRRSTSRSSRRSGKRSRPRALTARNGRTRATCLSISAEEGSNPRSRRSGAIEPGSNLRASWEELLKEARGCTRCELYKCGTQTVFGEGPLDASILFVGEQPGDQEDLAGRPFVGPAGQLFDAALEEAGIDRSSDLRHQRGQAFQIHPARQAADPQQARRRRDQGLPLVARAGAGADPAAGDRRARGDRGALAVRQGRDHQQACAGRRSTLADGGECWVTVHPSFLLRIPERGPPPRGARRLFVARPQADQGAGREARRLEAGSATVAFTVRGAPGAMLLSLWAVGK